MALVPSVAAAPIAASYATYTATGTPSGSFPTEFASSYNTYAIAGVLSGGGGVSGSEDPSIISSFMTGLAANTTPTIFGTMLANYWATCLLIPSGGVVSVSNNALAQTANFIAAVSASITEVDTPPYFEDLISNVQSTALSTVTWTCVRTPSATTFETVS